MGRIANFANTIKNSGARLGPLDILFTGLDYAQGKQEGEDDFRAAGGAASSTLGGWGGALAGGAAGAAVGSVVPVIGTAVGGAVGAIAGGLGGGTAGGWAFDRADEAVRGNTNRIYSPVRVVGHNNLTGPLAAGAVLAGTGIAATQLLKGKKSMINPFKDVIDSYQLSRGLGLGRGQSFSGAASLAGKYVVDGAGRVIAHPATKVGGAIGAGVIGNNMLGNPIGGAIDAATGGGTNFKRNENDPLGYQHQLSQAKTGLYGDTTNSTGTPSEDAFNEIKKYIAVNEYLSNPNSPRACH